MATALSKGNPVKKHLFTLCCVLGIFAFSGCAYTSFLSVHDPDYKTKSFKSVMVYAPFRDIRFQNLIEESFRKRLAGRDVEVVKAFDVIPPTRELTESQIAAVLTSKGIESILLIGLTDFWTTSNFVQSSVTTGQSASGGGTNKFISQTLSVGGYSITKPNATFECRLIDVATGKTAWLASAATSGDKYSDFTTLVANLSSNMARDLTDKKALQQKR